VALVIKVSGKQFTEELMTETAPVPHQPFPDRPPMFIPGVTSSRRLEPRDHAEFFEFGNDKRFTGRALLSMNPDDLWIEVDSHSTPELVKVPGESIQEAIRDQTGWKK
jgi:hypothetical protein